MSYSIEEQTSLVNTAIEVKDRFFANSLIEQSIITDFDQLLRLGFGFDCEYVWCQIIQTGCFPNETSLYELGNIINKKMVWQTILYNYFITDPVYIGIIVKLVDDNYNLENTRSMLEAICKIDIEN